MKKFMMTTAATVVLAFSVEPVLADPPAPVGDSSDITLTALVVPTCTIAGGPSGSVTFATVGSTTIADFSVVCNQASTVTLASENGAVTLGDVLETTLDSPPSGFTNKIDYTASIESADSVSINTASSEGAIADDGDFATAPVSTVDTTVSVTAGTLGGALLPGTYTDTLTVSINPS